MGLIETVGAVVAGVAALALVIGRMLKRARQAGESDAQEMARRLDHENAAAIRDRARNSKRVQPKNDTRGFRD